MISLHCPLTDETRNLFGPAELEQMKPGAILVNTAHGGLVDSEALVHAFREHIAWATLEARHNALRELAENIRAFLEGRDRNRVA